MYNSGQPQQQQQTGYGFQSTNYGGGGGGFPAQYGQQQPQGSFPAQQPMLQPLATGFYPQQPQQQQQQYMQSPGLPMQQTGYMPQPQLQFLQSSVAQPQQTGFPMTPSVVENSELKIPLIRLSFMTADEQKKYEHLFRTAVPKGELAISGDSASNILLRSGLSPVMLAEIWSLSDTNQSGLLLFPEFALSLHLCSMVKRGESLPSNLPQKWANEVQSFLDAINFTVPEDPNKILANTPFAKFGTSAENDWLAPKPTGYSQQDLLSGSQFGGANQILPQRTGSAQPGQFVPLQPQQTAGLIPTQKTGPMQVQHTGFSAVPQVNAQLSNPAPLQPQSTGYIPQLSSQTNALLQSQATSNQMQPMTQQRTGNGPLQPQYTGFQPQATGFQSQATGFQQQATGYGAPLQQQATGYGAPLQQQATGYGAPLQQQATGFNAPLQAQPTGRPGEWGFVSMPTGGIPGLNAMQQHFLPNAQLSSNNLQDQMGGSLQSNVTDAITKQEKQIYDGVFRAWDTAKRGFIDGDVALKVFGKSGLSRPDLESIWTLADTNDSGKLNKDEFAVAMHLIYRRLNNYEIPLRLPPELIPPSNRLLQDSMETMKSQLKGGSTTGTKQYQQSKITKPDGPRFKNDDNNFGYVSSSRHQRRTTDSGAKNNGSSSSANQDTSIDQLKKTIHEKKVLLEALDAEDHDGLAARSKEDSRIIAEIEALKKRIVDAHSRQSGAGQPTSSEEKRQLLDKLNHLARDILPRLVQDLSVTNQKIHDGKVNLLKLKLSKAHPEWSAGTHDSSIVGTGPNGQVTDLDRRKHDSKMKLKQRMAALTGKPVVLDAYSDLDSQVKQESELVNKELAEQSSIIDDIAASIKELEEGCVGNLCVSDKDDVAANKWHKGEGVSAPVAAFIRGLSSMTTPAKPPQPISRQTSSSSTTSIRVEDHQRPLLISENSASLYSSAEERSAYIKAQAQKRMNERLQKLGISRNKGESRYSAEASPSKPESPKSETPLVEPPKSRSPKSQAPVVQSPAPSGVAAAVSASEHVVGKAIPASVTTPDKQQDTSSDEDDDEEYKLLMKQKQEMETRERDRKMKKQKQKEERLAKIKREMEAMRNAKPSSDSSDDDDDDLPVAKTTTYKPPAPVAVSSVTSLAKEMETTPVETAPSTQDMDISTHDVIPSVVEEKPAAQRASSDIAAAVDEEKPVTKSLETHSSNPFAKQQGTMGSDTASGTNPFFKPAAAAPIVDAKKADAQRQSQRGLSTDNGWSDDEDNSSDDEVSNRAGAAHLANLLFGSMGASQPSTPRDEASSSVKPEASEIPDTSESANELRATSSDLAIFSLPTAPSPSSASPPPQAHGDEASNGYDASMAMPPAPPVPNNMPPRPVPSFIPPPPPPPPPSFDTAIPPPPPPAPPSFDTSIPPPPPPAPPSFDTNVPPPPPPPAPPSFVASVPPPPPPPPQPMPGTFGAPAPQPPPPPSSIPSAPAVNPIGGQPNIGALLGQITGGKSLRKVNDNEKKESTGAMVGRVV